MTTKMLAKHTVIIEGVDNIGKTTLVNVLKKRMAGYKITHLGKPEEDPWANGMGKKFAKKYQQTKQLTFYADWMRRLDENSEFLLFDRGHLGEIVYGSLYRGYDSSSELKIFECQFNLSKVLLVLLNTDKPEEIKDDGKSHNPKNLKKELKAFRKAFDESFIPNKLLLSTHQNESRSTPDELADDILWELMQLKIM